MRYLDVEDLVHLADVAVGGQALVRDLGLLSAAAARPSSGFGDFEAYPSVTAKAAALLHSINRSDGPAELSRQCRSLRVTNTQQAATRRRSNAMA